ncbi:MAG: DNA-directed RNA polymerase subunit RpoH/Rpb5 C-terminal domain-containing protein [archaeon]
MHTSQIKHSQLNEKETEEFLKKLNVSKAQLPKILLNDAALPENSQVGDVIKIERKDLDDKPVFYYRVVV